MKQVLRRALTGLLGGTFLSPVLCLAFRDAGLGLALGALLGIVQALAFFDRERKSALDCAMTSGALGLPAWAAINVLLSSGEGIPSESFIWTAGAAPNPIVQTLPVDHDRRGADVVEPKRRLRGYANVWALGDCASVPDVKPAKACPPTAQAAIREAAVLAHNLRASLLGQPLNAFHLKLLGSLCVVGYHTACAEIGGLKFRGCLRGFSGGEFTWASCPVWNARFGF